MNFASFLFQSVKSIDHCLEGLNGVYRQLSNGLKINRQPSKKLFFSVNHQKCRSRLTVKKFQSISNLKSHYFTGWSSRNSGSKGISKLENRFPCSQTKTSFKTLQYLTTCLYVKIFRNFISEQTVKTTSKTHNLILIHTEVNFTSTFGLNRPLARRGHVTNTSLRQLVGVLLMPKIDRAHKNCLTPKIWEEKHLRKI